MKIISLFYRFEILNDKLFPGIESTRIIHGLDGKTLEKNFIFMDLQTQFSTDCFHFHIFCVEKNALHI